MTEAKLKIVWADKTYEQSDVTYGDLVSEAEANGFSDEDGEAITKWIKAASTISFVAHMDDNNIFDLTHLFKTEPQELLDFFESEDYGAITFACATLGAHWFSEVAQIYDAISSIHHGSFNAEDILSDYLPELYSALDDACAWSYFDTKEFVDKNLDFTVEEGWYNGEDYWSHD